MTVFLNESMDVKAKEFVFKENLYSFTDHVPYLKDSRRFKVSLKDSIKVVHVNSVFPISTFLF